MSADATTSLELAVVGLAGRFPGARTVEAFWQNLRSGTESIRDLSEEELRAAGADDALLADPALVRRAADLADIDRFDARLFRFTPREAELTDPQFRIFLEDAWTALENAGHLTDRHERRVGVFAGASSSSYFTHNLATNPAAARAVGSFAASLGNARDYLATQVSYRLDLRGPSLTVQTACSTSLVAVHAAAQSLLNHECDIALAGGVSVSVPQTSGYLHEEGDIASPDGRCRAFDAHAAGCLKGNGSGVVVLRRLDDARRDGDTVLAVILGSAVNNDGNAKVGFTAPSVAGQAGVIQEALAVADVSPASISYVEAHGTATTLGDPIEVAALTQAFGADAAPGRCALGSVKSNVGHLDAAAGITGFIKAVLCLRHGELVPSLHFTAPNPAIDFAASPFFVNTELRPWSRGGGPRRAAVSSFGIGGTNAHVILEEAPAEAPSAPAESPAAPQLLVLSAASPEALAAASTALANHLESGTPSLADVAYTLQVGRKRLPHRLGVVAADEAAAVASLRSAGGTGAGANADERQDAQVAFLFPGQGSQHAGMVRRLYPGEPRFRDALDRCADALQPALGLDLRQLLLAAPDDAAANDRLRDTALAQPALFAVEHSLATLWMSWGVQPSAMAGHSIGEYVAAQLAGVFSLEDALALVAERGRLMASVPPGTMLAVPQTEADLARRLAAHPALSLAVINGPSSCVASGPEADIVRLEEELQRDGVAFRRLHTSHAFHSAMMDPILAEFESRVRAVARSAPSLPFLSNVSGTWITAEQATDPAYWAGHLRRTVRFADNLDTLADDDSRVLLEVGPGRTLTSAARAAHRASTAVASLPAPNSGDDDHRTVLDGLGRLWAAGVAVDWNAFHAGERRRRVPLPTYPFQRDRYWIEPGEGGSVAGAAPEKNPDLAEWFWIPGWKRSFLRTAGNDPEAEENEDGAKRPWMILDDGSPLSAAVQRRAEERGVRTLRVLIGDDAQIASGDEFRLAPGKPEHWHALVQELQSRDALPDRIVHLWCSDGTGAATGDPTPAFPALLGLLQALGATGDTDGLRFVAAVNHLFDVAGDPVRAPERATVAGFCRVAPQEFPGSRFRCVDTGRVDPETAAAHLVAELDSADPEPATAWRGGHRWVPSYQRVRLEADASPSPLRPGGVYALTGDDGELEQAIAERLRAAGAAEIVRLKEHGPCPVRALDELRSRTGRIDAVFHTEGEIGGGMIQLKEPADADRILAPRLTAGALAAALQDGELLVNFSSAISSTGVFGQADYCAGSAYLDALADSRASGPGPRVLTLAFGMAFWDRWTAASGAGAESLLEELETIRDAIGITVAEGVEAAWRALTLGVPRVVITTQDLDEQVAQALAASMTDLLPGLGAPAAANGSGGAGAGGIRTDTERAVAGVWTDLLGVPDVGREDNFFDLGGNSLLAIQLASTLRKQFRIDLTIASLFEATDLAGLAAAVDSALEERRAEDEVARLLEEIEGLSEDEVRAELERGENPGETP